MLCTVMDSGVNFVVSGSMAGVAGYPSICKLCVCGKGAVLRCTVKYNACTYGVNVVTELLMWLRCMYTGIGRWI